MHSFFLILSIFLLVGCNSIVTKILPPDFKPVTKERCEALNFYELGKADGLTAQRPGEKFDFWNKDCAQVGFKVSREEYDRGYQEGIQIIAVAKRVLWQE